MAKARTYERGFPWFVFDVLPFLQYQEQGPDYLAALIKGYGAAPAGMTMPAGMNYNKYFPGHMIGMPQPMQDGQITYDDGTKGTIDQYAKDVTAFMMWAAEPHMEARKRIGMQVLIFLIVFAGLLYFTKKKVWAERALSVSGVNICDGPAHNHLCRAFASLHACASQVMPEEANDHDQGHSRHHRRIGHLRSARPAKCARGARQGTVGRSVRAAAHRRDRGPADRVPAAA